MYGNSIRRRTHAIIQNVGVGGSNPSCGTSEINLLGKDPLNRKEAVSALCPHRRCRSNGDAHKRAELA
jgi:hypothetical protein